MRIDMFIHKNDYMVDEIRHRDLIQQSPTLDSDQHKPMDFKIKFVAVWKLLGYWGMRFSGWGFKLQAWAGIYYDRPVIKPSYYRMGMNEDFCCILLENQAASKLLSLKEIKEAALNRQPLVLLNQ